MKKFYSFFLFLFTFYIIFAQRDTDHWFAPMVERSVIGTNNQNLYLSTDITTPFNVQIFSGGNFVTPILTITGLSKGNPKIAAIPKQYIVTTGNPSTDVFNPNCIMGLYVTGINPFFARLGLAADTTHAEMVTSKGKAALGTKFYSVNTQMYYNYSIANFMTAIMATEDNTQVTVSGYNPIVQFSNGTTGTTNPTLTFTLNKGRSYIIEGWNSANNFDSFIGAKIISNKPISVTNGNYNGNYVTTGSYDGSDNILDQSVPVERLGNTFAIIKGNGAIGNTMEGAMVVATEDNTSIYVNNETTPLTTINAGQYYRISENKFINQGGTGHYNMYIQTTKNAYVFQLLGGIAGNNATEGFNYIPPLNCFLPKKIDEIGHINLNPGPAPTKLNIVTQTGAAITATSNGTPLVLQGPNVLSGNAAWVTYSVPNVTGTIVVNSTSAVTAGLSAGSGTSGYGGYFAGASTVPTIRKTGECIPGIILEVDANYDTYQWFLNGQIVPGATNSTFTPTQPGYYTIEIKLGSCTHLINSQFKVNKCLLNSASVKNTCNTFTLLPALSSPSIPQALLPSSVSIITQPNIGTVAVNAQTGEITYTPNNPNVTATDTFTYTFCGNNTTFPECETVTLTVNIQQITVNNATINACNTNNGQGIFNLTTANITTNNPVTITYYPTLVDAQNENPTALINNANAYSAISGTIIYAVVKNNAGCKSIAQITLNTQQVIVNNATLNACNTNNGQGIFNLTTANVTANNPVTITYYPTLVDAQNENPTALINNANAFSATSGTIIYAVVKNALGCKSIAQITLNLFPLAVVSNYNGSFCDDNLDGIIEVNLQNITPQILNNPVYFTNVKYYLNVVDANAGNTNSLPNNWTYSTNTTIYIRVESPDGCPPIIKAINFSIGAKIQLLKNISDNTVCDDDLDGIKSVNLNDYLSQFTADPSVSAQYYATIADANNNTNPINPIQNTNGNSTYYIRFTKNGVCPNVGTLKITIKTPKKSDTLLDKTVCENEKTNLDAGPGFEAYLWNTGATTQEIQNVGAGNYWVELTFNGCKYKQMVEIISNPIPQITSVGIKNGEVTVGVIGGTPPYEYSLDGNQWQNSNVFSHLDWGNYTVFVKDKYACKILRFPFTIISLTNAITPNGDGVNDILDFSALLNKNEASLNIFDRYGAIVFKGSTANRFIWDGTILGRPVPTATYWYLVEWKEFGSKTIIQYHSWLLVKNRNDGYIKIK